MERLILDERAENPVDRVLARITVAKVSRELGMQEPPIKFFHPSDEDRAAGLFGYYHLGVVYLHCRLSQKEIISTARHEARHAYQDGGSSIESSAVKCANAMQGSMSGRRNERRKARH